jgi:competence protein ComEA
MEKTMLNRNAMVSLILTSALAVCATTAHAASTASDSLIRPTNVPTQATPIKIAAPININTTDAATLETIKGLGAAKAQSIIDYRTKHGAYQSLQELENVPGIGPKLLAKIQGQLTLK